MQARLGSIVCKFGSDPATYVVEVAICAKFTDRQTDGRRTPRDCISSFQWNELMTSYVTANDLHLSLTEQQTRISAIKDHVPIWL